MENQTPIERACRLLGSQSALAVLLGVTPPAVNQWTKGTRPVPIEHCSAIERETKGRVTRQDLRPNDWQAIWPELDKPARRAKPEVTAKAVA